MCNPSPLPLNLGGTPPLSRTGSNKAAPSERLPTFTGGVGVEPCVLWGVYVAGRVIR